jgi:predicted lipoprotein with Yx(FWY)xxD motif
MTAAAAGALVLAGCGTSGGGGAASNGSGSGGTGSSGSAAPAATAADLKTFGSSLGAIVVDGKGMTVYVFDKDTAGSPTSACTGVCVPLWPAVTTTSATPAVQGVTGQVGTAPTADGGKQVTLDGHRLYTFAGDSGAGQLNGQGYQNLWYVVSPSGQKIDDDASSAAPTSSSGGYSY